MTLSQCHPEQGTAILSALTANQQSDVTLGQNGVAMHGHAGMDGTVAPNGMIPAIAPDDPFSAFDMTMHPYWTDSGMDLFTDLVGVEHGLTAMMAG